MIRIAVTMLVGDRAKFLGIVFGLSFAAMLMTQQGAIFSGVMALVYGHVSDTPQAELWISDPGLAEIDTTGPINERELDNVRAVEGVRWAVPLLRTLVHARDPDGRITPLMVLGFDDATGIGAPLPKAMVAGAAGALQRPDTVVIDEYGAASKLRVALPDGGSRALGLGDHLILNGRDTEVVGLCRSTLSLMLYPTAYMRRSHLSAIDPDQDGSFNFILAGTVPGADAQEVCRRISAATGLIARTRTDFSRHNHDFYLHESGIPANFAIAVLLGFVVGAAIAGQTFSQFVSDNRRIFASLKAMGMRDSGLMRILLVQATTSALLGLGLGVGGAALFGCLLEGTDLSFRLEPLLILIAFAAVLVISLAAAMLSLRSLLRLDPALVFRS
ncbi:MAG: FtsX-like permease family protein [Planctomycetes bacterium]|nr:FtsX-like permease family protein [Planctomycetota bacterium]